MAKAAVYEAVKRAKDLGAKRAVVKTTGEMVLVIEKCGFRFVKENIRITRDGNERVARYYVLDKSVL